LSSVRGCCPAGTAERAIKSHAGLPRAIRSEGSEPLDTVRMPSADEQPWSPFPVQDWSTLPADPLGSVAVNPTWPAPTAQRSWWRPLVIFGLVAALVAGAAFVASSEGVAARVSRAAGYLPSDGAASYQRTDTTREPKSVVGIAVTESARLSGVAGLLSTDSAFASRLLDVSYPDRDRIQILRTTTTAINDPAATAQTIRFYRVNTGVELMGVSTPSEGYIYNPALMVLPADVRAGSQWNGAGSAGDTLDYRSELHAEASGGDCVSVKGEVRYLSKEGQLGRVVTVSQTWCQREGIVAESQSFADVHTASSRINPPVPSIETTTNTPIRWTAPEHWTAMSLSTISINPTFGQGPMVGSPSSVVAPVRTESDLVIRATIGSGDLVATTPKTLTEWTSIWRAHPGGTVLSLSAFGNVIIATTSYRQLVAYSDVGVRLWQLSLDDLAPTSPVRISELDAVLVDLGGEMRRFDLVTGAVLWQQNVGSDVNVSPAVGAGVIVVMDRGGTTTAFEQATGKPRWDLEMQGDAAVVVGETVVVIQDQTAHALSTVSGRHRWVRPIFGTLTDMVSFASQVVVATKSQSVIVGGDGVVTQRLGPVLTLTATQDQLVAWGPTEALVIARDGKMITRWNLPALTLALQDRPALATSQSALLFSNDWTFQAWDDAG
jgi:outer membrane protein assembly factor BamB